MTNPDDNAFPWDYLGPHPGLTKREYFAAMAMQGCLQWDAEVNDKNYVGNIPEIVKSCVKIADVLIAELSK